MSFGEFDRTGSAFATVGDKQTSGNGSVMRNGPIPCFFYDDLQGALSAARQQSRLTHQGTEASECCALLTYVCWKAMNDPAATKHSVLSDLSEFKTDCPSVAALASSQQELPAEGAPLDPNRNWQWRSDKYHYSPKRAQLQPGYVGSYAMDALAMALHCVWTTDSLQHAMRKAANRCGDADSVTSVTGQICGALYGFSAIPPTWVAALNHWDGGNYLLRAYKMFYKLPVRYPRTESTPSAAPLSAAPPS